LRKALSLYPPSLHTYTTSRNHGRRRQTASEYLQTEEGDDPKEVLNWRLWLAVFAFGLIRAARGVDEGLISGTLDSAQFRRNLGIGEGQISDAAFTNIKGNIVKSRAAQ